MPNNKICFVIAPIGEDGSDVRKRSNQVLEHIIKPAADTSGYGEVVRADTISAPGLITSQVIQHILDDPMVIADLTGRNPNVYYELAIRHAVRKPVVQIIQAGEPIPFDVSQSRTIQVDHHDLDSAASCRDELIRQISVAEKTPSEVDTPISVTVDLQALRQSDDPLQKSNAEILSMLQDLRAEVAGLSNQPSYSPALNKRVFHLSHRLDQLAIMFNGTGVKWATPDVKNIALDWLTECRVEVEGIARELGMQLPRPATAAVQEQSSARAVVTVRSGGQPLPGADLLLLFPNKTWERVTTDAYGESTVDLHTTHLPITVFAAAAGYAAHLERAWTPRQGALAIELESLPGGGGVIFTEGTGDLPGLKGRLNPIRDTHSRTYLYASNIAINKGQQQPVHFASGEELRLTDPDGSGLMVRIVDIVGRSALVEYHPCPETMTVSEAAEIVALRWDALKEESEIAGAGPSLEDLAACPGTPALLPGLISAAKFGAANVRIVVHVPGVGDVALTRADNPLIDDERGEEATYDEATYEDPDEATQYRVCVANPDASAHRLADLLGTPDKAALAALIRGANAGWNSLSKRGNLHHPVTPLLLAWYHRPLSQ